LAATITAFTLIEPKVRVLSAKKKTFDCGNSQGEDICPQPSPSNYNRNSILHICLLSPFSPSLYCISKMPSTNLFRGLAPLAFKPSPRAVTATSLRLQQAGRQLHTPSAFRTPASISSTRPRLSSSQQSWTTTLPGLPSQTRRTIFIQTESTPNPDAIKFLPNHRILPEGISSPFIEYLSPRSTIAPPHPSPLAAQLMNIDGVTSVFYGTDFITVTKAADANWAHVRPEVFALITEAVTSGQTIVNVVERKDGDAPGQAGQGTTEEDSLSYNENDSEVVGMIKELLETRIRPAIQEDGGDIEYRGFENGYVLLTLRGACRTCDSSTVTLKNGIEGMLMHYVSNLRRSLTNPTQESSWDECMLTSL